MFRSRRTVVLWVVAALLASSCGGSDSAERKTRGQATPDRSASLVFSFNGFNATIDPHRNPGGSHLSALFAMYDRLIHVSPAGELVPGLATGWKASTDGLSIELTLRNGVVFHDGTPFTADAVKASLERAKSSRAADPLVQKKAQRISSIDVVDDRHVRLTFSEPYFSVEYDLAYQLGAMVSPTALVGGADLRTTDAGAGPYQLVSWRPGESITLKRFEDYWDPDMNPLAQLEIRNVPDAEIRFNALRSGQQDIAALDSRQASDAEDAGLVVHNFQIGTYILNINADLLPEWKDHRVREAIQYAIDRAGLATAITGGVGTPVVSPAGPGQPGYNPDYPGDYYEYDPQRARDLLEDAGIDDLSVEVLILSRSEDIAIGEALQGQFADVGVTLQLTVTEPANYTLFTEGRVQALVSTVTARLDAVETLSAAYLPGDIGNPGTWVPPRLESAIDAAATTPRGAERDARLREAFGVAAEEGAAVSLYTLTNSWATNNCVLGFRPYLGSAPDLRGVGVARDCDASAM